MWRDVHLDVDIKKKNYLNIEVNQADDVFFRISLYDNGKPLNLVNGEDTIIVNYANANGTITGDSNIGRNMDKNVCNIFLPRNCTNSHGTAHMQVTINTNNTYNENKQTTSFPIDIKIHQSVVDGKEVSTNVNSMIDNINKATIEGNKVINNIKEAEELYPSTSLLYKNVQSNVEDVAKLKNTSATKDEVKLVGDGVKSNSIEIEVQKKRIDSLSRLEEGSTTGDAELIDARIDVIGSQYDNLGNSIRYQFKNTIGFNTFSDTSYLTDEHKTSGKTIRFNNSFFKGQILDIEFYAENTTINSDYISIWGTNLNEEKIDICNVKVNSTTSIILDCDYKSIACWIQGKNIINPGKVVFKVKHSKNIYECINDSNIKSEVSGFNLLGDEFIEKGKIKQFKTENNYYISETKDINILQYCSLKANQSIYLEVKSNDLLKSTAEIMIGIGYASGEKSRVVTINPNKENEIKLENEDASYIHLWCNKTNIISNGDIKSIITNYNKNGFKKNTEEAINNINNTIDKLKSNNLSSKTFGIVGDSYSTYKEWIPTDYDSWYSDDGNTKTNDIDSVKDTWWWKLSKDTGLSLLFNSSYSGSTICNTGYSGADSSATSLLTRSKNDFGKTKTLSEKPNIIFVFGGTNDSWANSPIGEAKYSNWTTEDDKNVIPAFCHMIDNLQLWNPQARIIAIVNTDLKTEIADGIVNASRILGIESLVLKNITKESGHPNKEGMTQIKDQIIKIL